MIRQKISELVALTKPLRPFFRSDWGAALLVAVGWQLIMLIFGAAVDVAGGGAKGSDLLAHMYKWDAGWYMSILHGSYENPASPSAVFYPLFPLTVWLAQAITFHAVDILILGLIINTLSLWVAITALVKIADFFVAPKYRWLVVGLFLTAPAAFFLHMFYSEALFCAVVFWAYLFALRGRWALMGVMLAVSTAARLPAVLFAALCGLEFMRAHGWHIRAILNRNLLWFLLAPLGFVAYGLFLHAVRGDFLAMLHAYDLTMDWAYHVFNPNIAYTILKEVYAIFLTIVGERPFSSQTIVLSILPVAGLAVLFATSIYALFFVKGRTIPLGIFGLISIIFFTLHNNTVSIHRYLVPSLTIYLLTVVALSTYKKLRPIVYAAIYGGILIQAYLILLFVNDTFAG